MAERARRDGARRPRQTSSKGYEPVGTVQEFPGSCRTFATLSVAETQQNKGLEAGDIVIAFRPRKAQRGARPKREPVARSFATA